MPASKWSQLSIGDCDCDGDFFDGGSDGGMLLIVINGELVI